MLDYKLLVYYTCRDVHTVGSYTASLQSCVRDVDAGGLLKLVVVF